MHIPTSIESITEIFIAQKDVHVYGLKGPTVQLVPESLVTKHSATTS